MDIRAAKPADAEAILRVLSESSRAAYAEILDEEHLRERFLDLETDSLRTWLEETAADETVVYLVAVDDGIVGFAQFLCQERTPEHVDGEAFLKSLYVAPSRWNEGIGGELLRTGIARLPEPTYRVQLAVFAANERAKAFYETHGFERTGRRSFDIGDASYGTDVYTRTLD